MAWSNRKREPRREWIEQGIGIFGALLFLAVDIPVGIWFQHNTGNRPYDWILGMVFIPGMLLATFALLYLFWHLLHLIGEQICDLLAKAGVDPRPRNRL